MEHVRKTFGASIALEDFTVNITSGELVCLLGPSGCGKTTALRILAGFEKADSGDVRVADQPITGIPVEKRNFGMVFQDYSLFPNMTARQNIDFGLKAHKIASNSRNEIIDRMLAITALEDQADKFPHQMSGGQKQRVALARAIATQPRVLLLDEPLSALDAKVRESLREEIRRLQRDIGVTTVFVTHDQHEALAVADRVGVMSKGRLEQIATPRELYENPVNPFVATFIGSINRIPAHGSEGGNWIVLGRSVRGSRPGSPGERADLGIRPEDIIVNPQVEGTASDPPSNLGRVLDISFLGPVTRVTVELTDGARVITDQMSAVTAGLSAGQTVFLELSPHADRLVVMS
jgi:putative spermidine/putrescine transport system ATP-binding protein